jgi:spore germination protein GerM
MSGSPVFVITAAVVATLVLGCDLISQPKDGERVARQGPVSLLATPEGETHAIMIYLPRRFMDDSLGLQAVPRTVPADQPLALAALTALVAGPNGDERADDFHYPLDRRTTIRGVQVEDRVAILDLGAQIDRVRGQPFSELAYWSLVYTLTEVSGVDRVALRREGVPLTQFGDPPFPLPNGGRGEAPGWARPRLEPRATWPPL